MNKKQLPVLLSSFLLLGSLFAMASAHAAEGTTGTIAVVDLQEVLQAAPQVNAMKEKLKAEFAPRQNQLLSVQKTLKTDIEKLQRDHAKMDKKTLDSLEKQIDSEQRDVQTRQLALQKDVFAAQDKALQGLLEQIKNKVEEIAKQKQLGMVLVKNSVVYIKDKVDITSDVIKLLK